MKEIHLVDEMVSFRQKRDVNGDDVGLSEELVHGDVLSIGNGLDPVMSWVGIETEDLSDDKDYVFDQNNCSAKSVLWH